MRIAYATQSPRHRDHFRPAVAPFVRNQDKAQLFAIDAAYRAWAHAKGLSSEPGGHRFRGVVAGRRIVFATGIAGTVPNQVEIFVEVDLPLRTPVLFDAASLPPPVGRGPVGDVAGRLLRGARNHLCSVGATSRGLRVRFRPLVAPDVLDAALERLFVALVGLLGSGEATLVDADSEESTSVEATFILP